MSKAHSLAGASGALLLTTLIAAGAALGKPAAPPRASSSVTEHDVRVCIGTSGSTPQEQVPACTKIINSGKIHPPHEGDFYATRAAAYYALKQFDAALADYNKALTFEQKGEFYFQRALVLLAKKDQEKARADLATVIKLNPNFPPAYFVRGLLGYQAADYKNAIEDFSAAIQHNPTYYQAFFARGAAKTRLGDDSGGKDDLTKARGMSTHVDDDMQKLGVVP